MALLPVRPRRENGADARVLRADQADEILGVERLLVESRFQAGNVAEGEIGLARFQHVRRAGGDVGHVQPDVRADAAKVGENPRENA